MFLNRKGDGRRWDLPSREQPGRVGQGGEIPSSNPPNLPNGGPERLKDHQTSSSGLAGLEIVEHPPDPIGFAPLHQLEVQRGGVDGASVDGRQTSGIPSASSHPGAVPAQNIGWTGEVQGLKAVDGTRPRFEPVRMREEFIPQPGKPRMALDRGGHASPAPAGIRQRTNRRAEEGGLGTTSHGDAISAPAPCDATTPGRR